eukprot:CAMPEP_0172016444 /NCGR_PEP_ID=MMETSP1041-20130122/11028_1 /TAXON_ID=464988 /ORGANISM="Hemiselmis andersenii, Strain CCMP439" /LENGTH=200 /DNA_ID=CAMNT_0012671395 /DNA_START=17 /DNA_END=616 /DNA_ORIENTATION=+
MELETLDAWRKPDSAHRPRPSCDDDGGGDGNVGGDAFKSFHEVRHGKLLKHSYTLACKTAARHERFERGEVDSGAVKDKWRAAMIKRSNAGRTASGWRESTKDFWAAEHEKLKKAEASRAQIQRKSHSHEGRTPSSPFSAVSSPFGAVASPFSAVQSKSVSLSLLKKSQCLSGSSSAESAATGSSAMSEAGTNPSSLVSR